jgi:hypothetical protein
LLPFSLLALPVVAWVRFRALAPPEDRLASAVSYVLIGALVTFYVSAVGIGDTETVTLFGFCETNQDSSLTKTSEAINTWAAPVAVVAFVTLVIVR